ncbi:MAG TPA: hypothetical protein VN581_03185 [Patescibacteria group bacterium]|nr:hypothetical protein [Patescibacteria group bacterium]
MRVSSVLPAFGLAAFVAAMQVAATAPADAPAFIAETQYTAVFTQSQRSWLLHPTTAGALMRQDVRCRDDAPIAPGLWLVTTDAVGQVELVAPSVTPLPPGHSDRIPLLSCDSAASGGLHLPARLIETLAREHGAVRIDG